jgi:hypothetical protein
LTTGFNTTIGNYLKTADYSITHSNIITALDAKANLSGAKLYRKYYCIK